MTDRIEKFLGSLDVKTKERLKKLLSKIKRSPYECTDLKKLNGLGGNFYRVRLGKIRIILRIEKGDIEIMDIDYRGNIY